MISSFPSADSWWIWCIPTEKKAYVFYDDSWVGIEPYNGRFQEFGFDGLIKCVFSGYEAEGCAPV